eukprot:jgi/Astpho2/3738/Aster-04922
MSAEGASPSRNILVPVDDSEENERALSWALENMYRPGDVLHFLHVVPHHASGNAFAPQTEQQEELMREHAKTWIQERFAPIIASVKAEYKIDVQKGSDDPDTVGEHICHMAEQLQAAAVICAAHNKGHNVKYLVGSNTQYTMRNCSQTVLVMH